jgi:hypothetical protein
MQHFCGPLKSAPDGRFIGKWSPNTPKSTLDRFPAIENDEARLQLGQIDPTLTPAWPC